MGVAAASGVVAGGAIAAGRSRWVIVVNIGVPRALAINELDAVLTMESVDGERWLGRPAGRDLPVRLRCQGAADALHQTQSMAQDRDSGVSQWRGIVTQIIVDTRQTDTQQIDTRQKDAHRPRPCASCGRSRNSPLQRYDGFRGCGARLHCQPRQGTGHRAGRARGLEPRALRLPRPRGGPAHGRPQPVAAVAPQHASRPVRGGARRLPDARARYRQHDADRGRHGRHRGGYADLDRRRARGDGALFPASRQASRSPP